MKHSLEYITAIHEAGHVVAELKFRKNLIKKVTIVPNAEYSGAVFIKMKTYLLKKVESSDLSGSDEQYFKQLMISYMAGPAAHDKLLGRKDIAIYYNGDNSNSDIYKLYNLAFEMFVSEEIVNAYVNYIIKEAKHFVQIETNWRCIEEIAKELVLKKQLTRKQCKEIYVQVLRS